MTLNGEGGTDTLNVNDQQDTYGDTYWVSANLVQRAYSVPINFNSTTEKVNVAAGSGSGAFHLEGAAASGP